MTHPIILQELARARQRDLLNEAEARRLAHQVKAAGATRPGLIECIVHRLNPRQMKARERIKGRRISPQGGALKGA